LEESKSYITNYFNYNVGIQAHRRLSTTKFSDIGKSRRSTMIYSTINDLSKNEEIERLKTMAAKLRSEAASLEASREAELAAAAEKEFNKFDTDKSGTVSIEELKAGLEKSFKKDVVDDSVEKIMKTFDKSGNGELDPTEFVTLDKFRNKINEIEREDRIFALNSRKDDLAKAEAAKFKEALVEQLNDNPPKNKDKILSILPYLFPLLDGIRYGQFLLQNEGNNPLVASISIIYGLYRSIPFSGFLAFFALTFLSGNFKINRLIRYNMQQAILLDIALFFPSLLIGIGSTLLNTVNVPLPNELFMFTYDTVFVTLITLVAYCTLSSTLGVTPNKIPFISKRVSAQMPTVEMFDEQGQFILPSNREEKDSNDSDERK